MRTNTIGSGLQNLGNTCFFNAVLQIILYTPALLPCFRDNIHSQTCKKRNWCIFCSIEKLWKVSKQKVVVSPKEIVQNLRQVFTKFRLGRQEDSHEFLRFLIDGMQNCETTGKLGKDRQKNQILIAKTLIYKVFGGKIRTFVLCLSCRHKSLTTERYYDFSIECQRSQSLSEGLQNFFKVDELRDSNKYRCSNCKQLSTAQKGFKIISIPQVITFQFKRFTNLMRKINKYIKFPPVLDLSTYMQNFQQNYQHNQRIELQLYGVIVHAGSSTNSGHYYAFVKNGNSWFEMNDSNVRVVHQQQVLKQQAYLLFYRRSNEQRIPSYVEVNTKINGMRINNGSSEGGENGLKIYGDLENTKKKQIESTVIEQQRKTNEKLFNNFEKLNINKNHSLNETLKQKQSNNKILNNQNINWPVFGQSVHQHMQTRKSSINSMNDNQKDEVKQNQRLNNEEIQNNELNLKDNMKREKQRKINGQKLMRKKRRNRSQRRRFLERRKKIYKLHKNAKLERLRKYQKAQRRRKLN